MTPGQGLRALPRQPGGPLPRTPDTAPRIRTSPQIQFPASPRQGPVGLRPGRVPQPWFVIALRARRRSMPSWLSRQMISSPALTTSVAPAMVIHSGTSSKNT